MADYDITRIAGNIGALNSLKALNDINSELSTHQTRLSTGKRINSAADDPAGLTIATKMLSRSEGLKTAGDNIGDAKNLLAVAESGLGRINDILVQMRNKAETAASDTMGDDERSAIKTQLTAYAEQINDLVDQTKWNGKKLLNGLGDFGGSLTFQTGADAGETTVLSGLTSVDVQTLGVATVATTSDATLQTGATTVSAADYNAAAKFTGIDELESGSYSIVAHIGSSATDNTTADSYIQLLDSNGDVVDIDADGTDGGIVDNKLTFAYDSDTPTAINLGNGLQVTLANSLTASTDYDAESVSYTKAGSFSISATTASDFSTYMTTVTDAMNQVNEQMTKIGSLTSRLTFKEDQVSAAQINVESAYNRIMNADMAEEQVANSKYQILQQTATSMLAQANTAPQFLLSLFQ